MNFEDCKKVMIQYLEAKKAMEKLRLEHCIKCEERICHCNECPMMTNDGCKFGE